MEKEERPKSAWEVIGFTSTIFFIVSFIAFGAYYITDTRQKAEEALQKANACVQVYGTGIQKRTPC